MDVQKAYDTWWATYDAGENLTRDLDRIVAKRVLGELRCRSILEVGCGTGKNTLLLAKIGDVVTAVDFSAGMIAQAKAKISAQNVTFQVTDITRPWPMVDAAFDLITCNLILEHIEDLGFILAEAGRSLAADGKLFISELHPFRQYLGGKARFQQGTETTFIPAHIHHVSDFLTAAKANGLNLLSLDEWWHKQDEGSPPRLITFLFQK